MELQELQNQAQLVLGETLAIVDENNIDKQKDQALRSLDWNIDIKIALLEKQREYLGHKIFEWYNSQPDVFDLKPEPTTPLTPFINNENY